MKVIVMQVAIIMTSKDYSIILEISKDLMHAQQRISIVE